MFSLAAKLTLLLVAGQASSSGLTPKETSAWRQILPETVVLQNGKSVSGRAALIDSRGYFIAHRTSVPAAALEGKTSDGITYKLSKVAVDEPSGLVLLIARGWNRPTVKPVQVPTEKLKSGDPLLAVIGPGPMSAELATIDRFGVLAPSHRLVPLVEVKFEASTHLVGGALMFTLDGRFVGALNATLDSKPEAPAQPLAKSLTKSQQRPNFGPAPLTVAYVISPEALKSVIDGFCSPTHEVWRAQLGVACKDATGGGALIDTVTPASPADKAGLKVGDVIFQIGLAPVKNQVEFAKALMAQTPGATVDVDYLRKGQTSIVKVVLGKSKD